MLLYPPPHPDRSVATMTKFTPRSLIRKGFVHPASYLFNSFPIKREVRNVNAHANPPTFGLPDLIDSAVRQQCFAAASQTLVERGKTRSLTLVFGSPNATHVLPEALNKLRADGLSTSQTTIELPALPYEDGMDVDGNVNPVRAVSISPKKSH